MTAEDVERVAKKYLEPKRSVILIVGQKSEITLSLPEHPVQLNDLSPGPIIDLPLRDPYTMKPMPVPRRRSHRKIFTQPDCGFGPGHSGRSLLLPPDFARASSIFFKYFAGSFLKSSRQPLQHSLTTRPGSLGLFRILEDEDVRLAHVPAQFVAGNHARPHG